MLKTGGKAKNTDFWYMRITRVVRFCPVPLNNALEAKNIKCKLTSKHPYNLFGANNLSKQQMRGVVESSVFCFEFKFEDLIICLYKVTSLFTKYLL